MATGINYMFFLLHLLLVMVTANEVTNRMKRSLLFPRASGMGLFLALAIPVDLPQYELSLSYNFEANYGLPDNATELELGPQYTQIRYARSLTRSRVYNLLEERLEREGFIGKACLLRTICETAADPIEEHNGLLGDLLHLLFTPSSSAMEGLPQVFHEAEETGKMNGTQGCAATYSECPINFYSLFSVWRDH